MTRLISKLREQGMVGADLSPGDPLAAEAADEIDRLRAALEHIRHFAPGAWQADVAREALRPADELTGEA